MQKTKTKDKVLICLREVEGLATEIATTEEACQAKASDRITRRIILLLRNHIWEEACATEMILMVLENMQAITRLKTEMQTTIKRATGAEWKATSRETARIHQRITREALIEITDQAATKDPPKDPTCLTMDQLICLEFLGLWSI